MAAKSVNADRRDRALFGRHGDLLVDEGVIEAGGCRVVVRGSEIEAGEAGPIDRAQAHGARFTGRVQLTTSQLRPQGRDRLREWQRLRRAQRDRYSALPGWLP